MDIIFLTNSVSPHQLPLCYELEKQHGDGSVIYFYTESIREERLMLGWNDSTVDSALRILHVPEVKECHDIENSRILIADVRDISLFIRRARTGLFTLYMSERWFKPAFGLLRLLHPKFFKMAWRFAKLLRESDKLIYLPQGEHAARDMARLCGLMHGDLRCLFKVPKIKFERKPGGKIWLENDGDNKKYCLDKMRMWGYFVEPSRYDSFQAQQLKYTDKKDIKVLWVGRLLKLKRIDTIIQAVREHANLKHLDDLLPKITLDIYGTGPEETRLKKMAANYGDVVKFYPPVPISEVRKLMHEHDVYVLSSNGYEGWGAVVSEALEEGMKVIGTYEAGSSVTILPEKCLFMSGDHMRLLKLLQNSDSLPIMNRNDWSAKRAASALLGIINELIDSQ